MGLTCTLKFIAITIALIVRIYAFSYGYGTMKIMHSGNRSIKCVTDAFIKPSAMKRASLYLYSENTSPAYITDESNVDHSDEKLIDHNILSEREEKANIDYIDKNEVLESDNGESTTKPDLEYFDWDKVKTYSGDTCETVKSVDSTGSKSFERGERPSVSGHGPDMQFTVEDYELNTKCGRLNEWPSSWNPGEKVMSFFPIIIDEYSLHPSPLQLGFEDAIRFRGRHVESVFNSIIDKMEIADPKGNLETRDVYGLCFLNPTSGQLAPLAVYAEFLSKKAFVDGGGESLEVKGRVLGRVMISRVVLEEPFIKAMVTPIEDKPGLLNAEDVPKLVDEITHLHDRCNKMEMEMMTTLEQPYAVARIKERPNLHDLIDDRLKKFNIDISNSQQAFAQLAAYTAFDYHLTASERYDALAMQNTEDRLRFVRDNLRMKVKQLQILERAPKERLSEMVEQLKEVQFFRDNLYTPQQNTDKQ